MDDPPLSYRCPPYSVVRGIQKPLLHDITNALKITTSLPETASRPEPVPVLLDPQHRSHRNRAHVYDLQDKNLKLLLEAPNDGVFWTHIHNWLDKKKRAPEVSIEDLQATFEECMNPPATLPPSFDSVHRKAISTAVS